MANNNIGNNKKGQQAPIDNNYAHLQPQAIDVEKVVLVTNMIYGLFSLGSSSIVVIKSMCEGLFEENRNIVS